MDFLHFLFFCFGKQKIFNFIFSACWTMATRAALNPTSLEEHIQQRINSMQNGNLRKDSHPKTPLTTVINCEFKTNIENNNDENENQIQEEIKPSTSQTSNLDKKIDDIKKRPDSADSKSKSRSTSTDKPISLKNLQEMALTTFLRENWVDGQYEQIEVELHRDPHTGLGITVAGYVHKKGKSLFNKDEQTFLKLMKRNTQLRANMWVVLSSIHKYFQKSFQRLFFNSAIILK